MPYFEYHQNNSGGSFDGEVYTYVIEANDSSEANDIAENQGVYFNGCQSGMDCDCCGDRWSACYDSGDDAPSVYGKSVVEDYKEYDPKSERDADWLRGTCNLVRVINKDGTVKDYIYQSR